jgi:hypothetical protein
MSTPGEAYQLTEYIHDSFFKPGEEFTHQEIARSGVRAYVNEPYNAQQLYVHGEVDGRNARQALSKSTKNGVFYFSTVYKEPGGAYLRNRITPESPVELVEFMESTLFMQAIKKMQQARYQEE